MKQFFNHAFLGAIALTGAVCFSACSSKDDLTEEVNPTYDPATNTVKTGFTIALTSNLSGKTRMGESETQSNNPISFPGIKNIQLIPFDCVVTAMDAGTTRLAEASNISLTPITGKQLNAKNESYHYHYIDVTVPATTASMLFYGLTSAQVETPTVDNMFDYGYLEPVGLTDGNNATTMFELKPICPTAPNTIPEDSNYDPTLAAIVTYLTNIANATGWSEVTSGYLKTLYTSFTTNMKAASSANVRNTLQALYGAIYTDPGDVPEAIKTAILTTYAEDTGLAASNSATGVLNFKDKLAITATQYPSNHNLPDGAAVVAWDATNKRFTIPTSSSYKSMNVAELTKYVYPASLYYFAKSATMVSNSKQDSKYMGSSDWSGDNGVLSGFTEGSVTSSTVDVALKEQIQYAVGRMDLTVKCAASTLKDSKGDDISVNAAGFPVTGVIIGGQRFAKYDFTPDAKRDASNNITSGVPANEYTIYDKSIPTGMAATPTTATGTNHTLVLESGTGETVYIAVEFENNSGSQFVGADNCIIPSGGKFYLVAELTTTAGEGVTVPDGITSVFKQDYYTSVALTISANTDLGHSSGLGAAYNYVPDLGTPAMRFGFSVDLTWNQGIQYNLTF